MNSVPGLLVAIEGVDGAGKRTQVEALCREFSARGRKVSVYSFPDYDGSLLGGLIKRLLAGNFGDASKIHPMLSAPLFAIERSEKRNSIQQDLLSGCVVLCDRYVYSNVAHQACRLPWQERADFTKKVEYIEFELLGMPRPTVTALLDVDDEAARARRMQRAANMSQRPLDDYERDEQSLSTARDIYLQMAKEMDWVVVPTRVDGEVLDREAVTAQLFARLLEKI